ncbi:MAG TPA: hypothetical protein VJ486_06050 [Geothrix sp.]|nr:hypothetical protein [Geothrix sp.]
MKQASFEIFLDRLDPAWRGDQLAFFRVVEALGPEAVEELASRVHRVSCPVALKQLVIEFSYYFPWLEWIPVVDRLLLHEKNLALFETGVRALGRMKDPRALTSLRNLSMSRATPGFREVLHEVLREADPSEAFDHHFSRLLKGSTQPSDANDGAHQLAKLLTPESLQSLQAAMGHPDPLIFRHTIRLIGLIPTAEAADYLHSYLKDALQDALDDRDARSLLAEYRNLSRPEVQEKALQALSERWQEAQPGIIASLGSGQLEQIQRASSELRDLGLGVVDTFLLDTFLSALETKADHLTAHLVQAGEAAQQRTRRIEFGLDSSAQSLVAMATRGLIEGASLLPALAEPLRQNAGGVGIARALALVVPASNQELLDLLLDQPDSTLRGAALEVMGERKDPNLKPCLLKLRRDPISDLADRSLWHLGQLPDPEGTARAFLADPDPEEVIVGLRFTAIHRLEALVPDLLQIATTQTREAVLLEALNTLRAIGSPQAVEPLLDLLHSGQGPRIQVALGETIRDLNTVAGAFALCTKAQELNSAVLLTAAVEALARTHSSTDHPLPPTASDSLIKSIRIAWAERNAWALRRRIADAVTTLQAEDANVWTAVTDLIQETLGEKRPPGSVATEDVAHLQSCARALAKLVTA